LTAASDVLLIEPDGSPVHNYQAISRCHRIGQTNGVIAHFAYAHGTIDARISNLLRKRAADMQDLPEQLRKILREFMQGMGDASGNCTEITNPTPTTAEVVVEPAKRGRGRPPKDKGTNPEKDGTEDDTTTPDTAPADGDAADGQAEAPPVEHNENVVQDLSPQDARTKAISAMQKHFAANPNSMPAIAKLQQKFGIKQFSEIPDDRAHDLLADVLLIVNGTGEAYKLGMLADDGTRKSSVYSAQGTLAHSVSEVCVYTGKNPADFIGETKSADGFSFTIDEEFAEAASVYVDTLRGLRAMGYVLSLENRVSPQVHWEGLAPLDVELFGTSDCIAYNPVTKDLVIADLKFGAGIPVEADANPQLLYYAAGSCHPDVLDGICAAAGVGFAGVQNIQLIVVQPRAYHALGPVRRASYTYNEVRDWARGPLYYGVERALQDEGKTLCDGKHCRFCPVLASCDKPRETAFNTARAAFMNAPLENIPAPDEPGAALPDVHLSDDKLGDLLDKIEIIAPWLDAVKRLALERAQANRTVPGWKLVPKRALRKWADEDQDAMMDALRADGVDVDLISEAKLLSPAQAEKKLGKKEYAARIAPHVVKNSSGATLAPEGDPRARIKQRSAAEAFGAASKTPAGAKRAAKRLADVRKNHPKSDPNRPATRQQERALLRRLRKSDEAAIEAEIQEKGLTAPRITAQDVNDEIVSAEYHVFPGSCLTVCCLTLKNGFTVTGESACVHPANFNADLGRRIAHENARNKIWVLLGFRLRDKLVA
ncbi:putative multi-domain containing protein, partial [Aduncisulcus paluster]